ncbi:barstar family protein [Thauera sp. WH-1]|uniref:barstar family protein n=1 Tax=Thauera sp. WH-1 TaxID=3398230 RepID=UPI0039FD9E19
MSSLSTPDSPAGDVLDLVIDLGGCSDKAGLLERFASALHFPPWFGHNWDALSDCLTDLSWLPAQRYRITLTRPQDLRAADPETLATALDILQEAAEFWADEGVCFDLALSETLPPPAAPASAR